jgi:biotin synthase
MQLPHQLEQILNRALEGHGPSKDDCIYLLSLPANSLQAAVTCSVADAVWRRRSANRAILQGQIGIEITPCPGRCKFCSFGEQHTAFAKSAMAMDEIVQKAGAFTADGSLNALFLMTMHVADFDWLESVVAEVRAAIPHHTRIVVNTGDFDLAEARALRAAGANGAYHVCRLREGTDSELDPEQRKQTIRAIKDAGLDWYYCCEPIGPEHSPEEIADQLFLGIEYGSFQHAAMRRVYLPSSPLAAHGQITERHLAQVVAVVALASLASPETQSIAVHEPNLLGLTAGANAVYAEAGANPRDLQQETAGHRGHDVLACRTMLYEAGFRALLLGDGATVPVISSL